MHENYPKQWKEMEFPAFEWIRISRKLNIEEAKDACFARQFDKVQASLEKGEKLLIERRKRILLADKSDFG